MTSRRSIRLFAGFALSAALIGASSLTVHAAAPDAVSDNALGVAFTTIPSGWQVAPAGQYMPGSIGLLTPNGEASVSVQPLGTADTANPIAAATAAADELIAQSNSPTPVTLSPVTVAGIQGVQLNSMPGPTKGSYRNKVVKCIHIP